MCTVAGIVLKLHSSVIVLNCVPSVLERSSSTSTTSTRCCTAFCVLCLNLLCCQINWIRQRLETPGALELDKDEKRLLLARITRYCTVLSSFLRVTLRWISRSMGFENFLAKKWTAEKRFGLEGVEMLIPCMKQVGGKHFVYKLTMFRR